VVRVGNFLCYFVGSGGNLVWVIVWGVVVIFIGYYLEGESNLLLVNVWRVEDNCNGLLCGERW